MPVFYYLDQEEVADAYLYLRLYPPDWTVPDPVLPVAEQQKAASNTVPVELSIVPTTVAPPSNARDLTMIVFPIAAEIFVGLLLAGGFWFTLREIRRLTALRNYREALVMGDSSLEQHASQQASSKSLLRRHPLTPSTSNDNAVAVVASQEEEQVFHYDDYRRFESSWLARWLEGEDEAA